MWGGTVRKYNQYTQDIIDYNNEHGTDIFLEYKQESTSDERKKEIEDWLFNLLRERGEVPKLLWNDNEIASSLIRLSNADSSETYQDGVFGFNSSGIDVLYHFFPEINDVRKQSCPDSINDYLDSNVNDYSNLLTDKTSDINLKLNEYLKDFFSNVFKVLEKLVR